MKSRPFQISVLLVVVMVLSSGRTLAVTTEPTPTATSSASVKAEPTDATAAKTEPTKTKLVLEKGMKAETIVNGYGKPYEIKPMESPDKALKVEQWIYRRKVKETSTQTASGQTMIPVYVGAGLGGGPAFSETPVIEHRLKHITVYQVTELLMVNDKLEAAKVWMGQEEKQL